jgi:tetratricopeptide (TPR) repeat protein
MAVRKFVSMLLLAAVPAVALAQATEQNVKPADDSQERRALLVERIIAEVSNLRLPENRAFVLARTGALVCKSDPKEASDMFRGSIGELVNAQMTAEAERKQSAVDDLLNSRMTRPTILRTIAQCDSEFALDSFYKSRPTAVQRALIASPESLPNGGTEATNSSTISQNELNLEQSLMRFAAEQNPARAKELIEASLKKGLSGETVNLLIKLNKIDPERAASLAGDVTSTLLGSSFGSAGRIETQSINAATQLLYEYARPKRPGESALKLDPQRMKELVEKLVAFFATNNNPYGSGIYARLIPAAEKLSPTAYRQIKVLDQKYNRGRVSPVNQFETSKFLQTKPAADAIMAYAKKAPSSSQPQLFITAANRVAEGGDYDRALAMLSANLSGDTLDNAVSSLNWFYAHALMNQGKFSDAERLIDQFGESNRRVALLELAKKAYKKDPVEQRTYAVGVLDKARTLIPDSPETVGDTRLVMQLVAAYIEIEPDSGFHLFESLVPRFNEVANALAIVSSYQGSPGVRQREFVLNNGSNGFNLDLDAINAMAGKDLARTLGLIDMLDRPENRVSIKLQLAQGR